LVKTNEHGGERIRSIRRRPCKNLPKAWGEKAASWLLGKSRERYALLNVPLKDERWLRPNLDYLPEKLPVGG
jgi:hypothetical protein